jgi:protoporphyrinogen oxidase
MGAGPAGLTAAYELSKQRIPSVTLELDDVVGGLSRTVNYRGFLFDLGGHRFFTKVSAVEKIWNEVLGGEMILRPRLSRIFYQGKYFHYPLEPWDVVKNLGLVELFRCALSYLKARLNPTLPEDDFATWVSNRFGERLFRTFFESYTEKVWGIPCKEIKAEWASQRIRGLSFSSAVRNALFPARDEPTGKSELRTLTKEFRYPRKGPGMMWERMAEIVRSRGNEVRLQSPVDKVFWEPGAVTGVRAGGEIVEGSHYLSTLPVRHLVRALDPPPPAEVRDAAESLSYRDFLTVALMVKGRDLFPDNWVYVHDPAVKVGRIQNFTNWSPEMSPDPEISCLGLEYFCSEGDALWSLSDEELLRLGQQELAHTGLAKDLPVIDGAVVRVYKAYPVYDDKYKAALDVIRDFLDTLPNLQLVGRNGQHRYNNQDHSMLAAMLAVRNIQGARFDLWNLNTDQDYQEEGFVITEEELAALEASQPLTPRRTAVQAVR